MLSSHLDISCLCGKASQQVIIRGEHNQQQLRSSWQASQKLCHCHACRHLTGLLCASFLPITRPSQDSLSVLKAYRTGPQSTAYFCPTCGCHVFRSRRTRSSPGGEPADGEREEWLLATGIVVGSPSPEDPKHASSTLEGLVPDWKWEHERVSDTKDGGLSIWIDSNNTPPLESSDETPSEASDHSPIIAPTFPPGATPPPSTTLPASCHCGTVRFHITRPDARSQLPASPFPDLMIPYCRSDPRTVQNPLDVKWWLRQDGTRYLAGTCACRSCRLASGFEIQTWAFIPRSNIFIYPLPSGESVGDPAPRQLDFETVPPGVLRSYESSPGVAREFCPRCGATIFWHNMERPDLIDVSVGLLEAPEGARAESWLEWWTARVSFAEDAGAQMPGQLLAAVRAKHLIQSLENGLESTKKGG